MPAPLRWLAPLLAALVLGGCASAPLQHRDLGRLEQALAPRVELAGVPFYAQEAFHCGPAALAMVMNRQGEAVRPDELAPRVFIERRRGSLQAELVAATRRQGLIAYELEPRFGALLEELDAGNPVLVLKNLGLESYPAWHYAVVIGYDLERRQVLLRSGTTARKVLSFRRFERRWQGGGYWALTLHRPGEFPARPDPTRYLSAAAGLEHVGRLTEAASAYRAAAVRWPKSAIAWLGLGNVRYREGRYGEAEAAYRNALEQDGDSAAAHHNLAWALIRQHRRDEARIHALSAHRLAPEGGERYRGALAALGEANGP